MKFKIRMLYTVVWIIVASVFLTRTWITHPEWFPAFPKPLAEYLVHFFGAQNAEQIADVEILVGLSISVPIMCVITLLAWRFLSRRR